MPTHTMARIHPITVAPHLNTIPPTVTSLTTCMIAVTSLTTTMIAVGYAYPSHYDHDVYEDDGREARGDRGREARGDRGTDYRDDYSPYRGRGRHSHGNSPDRRTTRRSGSRDRREDYGNDDYRRAASRDRDFNDLRDTSPSRRSYYRSGGRDRDGSGDRWRGRRGGRDDDIERGERRKRSADRWRSSSPRRYVSTSMYN